MSSFAAKSVLDFADSLPGPYGYERSIKFTRSGVFDRRFLVTFPAVAIEMGADLSGLLNGLRCPSVAAVDALLKRGSILHLGIEEGQSTSVCKFYVEDADRIRDLWEQESLPHDGEFPVHRSIKWQLGASSWVETEYDWLPAFTEAGLLQRAGDCLPEAVPLLQQILTQVPSECPVNHLQLLRVTEAGNPRLSLDLNLYDAQLKLSSLRDVSASLAATDAFALLLSSALATLDAIGHELLGHIALGIGRDGESFLTLYYGVCERGAFNDER